MCVSPSSSSASGADSSIGLWNAPVRGAAASAAESEETALSSAADTLVADLLGLRFLGAGDGPLALVAARRRFLGAAAVERLGRALLWRRFSSAWRRAARAASDSGRGVGVLVVVGFGFGFGFGLGFAFVGTGVAGGEEAVGSGFTLVRAGGGFGEVGSAGKAMSKRESISSPITSCRGS